MFEADVMDEHFRVLIEPGFVRDRAEHNILERRVVGVDDEPAGVRASIGSRQPRARDDNPTLTAPDVDVVVGRVHDPLGFNVLFCFANLRRRNDEVLHAATCGHGDTLVILLVLKGQHHRLD